MGNKRVIEWLVEDTEATAAGEPARAECAPRTLPEAPVPALLAQAEPASAEVPAPQVKQDERSPEEAPWRRTLRRRHLW